jgi:phage shock protein A
MLKIFRFCITDFKPFLFEDTVMRLLNRCAKILKQGADVFLAPAEDPRKGFPTPQGHQRNLLRQVEQALIETRAFSIQLRSRKTALEDRLNPLEEKARQALQAGREDLARLALQRRQACTREIEPLNRQIQITQNEEDRLQLVKNQLETQIETMQARQQVLNARYSAAEAQVRLNESLSGVAEQFSDLGLSLEEAEQQAEKMQARAEAINDLLEIGVLETPSFTETDSVTQELTRFDDSQAIENQLAALKQELQASNP